MKIERDSAGRMVSEPDDLGHFGPYGGMFIAETLMEPVDELRQAYQKYLKDPAFLAELDADLQHYVGRPSPLYHAERLSRELGGAQIYLKREDLNHTGAHKINNTVGQALLADYMGKSRIIAETGAGQHGVASATVAARLGTKCIVYMGEVDAARQRPNVQRMKLLGATVVPVGFGGRTLKEAVDSAFQSYLQDPQESIYAIGSVVGPHPFPMMVRDFQRIVGQDEAIETISRAVRRARAGGSSFPSGCEAGIDGAVSVEKVAERKRLVVADHLWIMSAPAGNLFRGVTIEEVNHAFATKSTRHAAKYSRGRREPLVGPRRNRGKRLMAAAIVALLLASTPGVLCASMITATGNMPCVIGAQFTSTQRSGCLRNSRTLAQRARCTTRPSSVET